MNYIFKTTATMKEYNNKKWYIDSGIVSDMRIDADSVVYARKKHGGASCYLVSPDTVQAFIRYETWAQGVANCFCNITVKPYKGRKYNPAFGWVCVG